MKKADSRVGLDPSQLITNQIAKLGDWRGKILSRLRKVILEADPDITEEWKWNTGCGRATGLFAAPVPSRIM
jgi:hypothetical protein